MKGSDPVVFSEVVTELLAMAATELPSAAEVKAAFAPRATRVETGNANLTCPPWAKGTRGLSDVFLTLSGDLQGMAIWDDGRGWGTYAELAVAVGTRADLEAVVGVMSAMPRNPGDFRSGPMVAAYVDRNGRRVRVFAELDKKDPTQVRRATVHFET